MMMLQTLMTSIARMLRRIIGLVCLGLAVLGFILPIIPGWPFIVPAVVLLGRRDPSLRRMHIALRHSLRFLRRSRHHPLRRLGVRLSTEYARGRRALVPHIDAAERAFRWG